MYRIGYDDRVINEDIPALPKSAFELIGRAIKSRFAVSPTQYGKPLRYNLSGYRRLRVADYRIVYKIDEAAKTVYVIAIQHRKDIYEEF